MAFGKWIGGYLGFMIAGPLGALAGVVLGALFDSLTSSFSSGGEYIGDDTVSKLLRSNLKRQKRRMPK